MVNYETIAKIRRYYFVKKKGIKEISRDLNISSLSIFKIMVDYAIHFSIFAIYITICCIYNEG